jgi:hypothetical protein
VHRKSSHRLGKPNPAPARRWRLSTGADIQALLAQGLRFIYDNDDEYIELPEAMEHAFRTAIDAKAVPSDAEPKSYREAMRQPDSELWHQAMVREMEAHLENSTWKLVELLHGRKAIGSK